MKHLFLTAVLLYGAGIVAQETIYECGTKTGKEFNGWYIEPLNIFSNYSFNGESIDFFSEEPTNITLSFVKRVDDLSDFTDRLVSFDFMYSANSSLEALTLAHSIDGKNWTYLQEHGIKNGAEVAFPNVEINYIKAMATVDIGRSGKFGITGCKITGEPKEENILIEEELPEMEKVEVDEPFYIFCFERTINVETQNEQPYEVYITNISGQVVQKEILTGSQRIMTNLPEGIYILSVIQDNKLKTSKKIAL